MDSKECYLNALKTLDYNKGMAIGVYVSELECKLKQYEDAYQKIEGALDF